MFLIALSFAVECDAQILCIQCFDQNDSISSNVTNWLLNSGFENNTCPSGSFCPTSFNYGGDITNWTCTGGGTSTYADPVQSFFSVIPQGSTAIYFGNFYASICSGTQYHLDSINSAFATTLLDASCIGSNGCEVTGIPPGYPFAGTPYGSTQGLSLSQTVNGLTPGSIYVLEFWAGGEAEGYFINDGVFGVDIGFGYSMLRCHPTDPSTGGIGTRFIIQFIATSTSHTIKFTNWGHICADCSELILDDARLYTIGQLSATVAPCINTASITGDTSLCVNDSLHLVAQGDPPYWWSLASNPNDTLAVGAALNLFPVTPGLYILHGDSTLDSTHVIINQLPVAALGNDTTVCNGNAVALNAAIPQGSYTWSNGSTQSSVTVTAQAAYAVTVTNAAGCSARDTMILTVLPTPQVTLPEPSYCGAYDSVLIAAPSGYTYHWQDGSTTQNYWATNPGTYNLTVTAPNGCSGVAVSNVSQVNVLVSLGGNRQACAGQQVNFVPAGTQGTYYWSDGATGASINVGQSGGYGVTVTYLGCTAHDSVYVTIIPYPNIALGNDTLICEHGSVTLNPGAGAEQYVWSNGATSQMITVFGAGNYRVIAGNQGCNVSDSITVTTVDCDLTFPNAFTPNGDGLNELFRPVNPTPYVHTYQLSVYNRWGQLVFSTADLHGGWNGTFNGKPCELGSYAWTCSYQNEFGTQHESGSVTLVR